MPCDNTARQQLFSDLLALIQIHNLPIICLGDFNVVTSTDEKQGGLTINPTQVAKFRTFISDLALYDPGFFGPMFTWSNRARDASRLIQCRLDRFLLSDSLMPVFPDLKVNHLTDIGSDHRVILLSLLPPPYSNIQRIFKFDNRLLQNPELPSLVHQVWSSHFVGSRLFILHSKFKALRHAIHAWQRSGVTNSARKIRLLTQTINNLRDQFPIPWSQISNLEHELGEACTEESHYWRQKCRNDWLDSGDRNTAFFHRTTIARQHYNRLGPLTDSAGTRYETEEEKLHHASHFYQTLFTSQFSSSSAFDENQPAINLVNPCITDAMNSSLTRPFTNEDIKKAVFSIASSKSPGSDGFTAGFYHKFWPVIGPDVCSGVQAFFHSNRMLRSINHTWLTLIPKVPGASSMTQVRPIGLCQMLYKIISKLLATRLATVLPSIISDTQNGFVPNRDISENVIIAHEVMHYLKRKKSGKKHFMAVKLDMEKAYDRIEWEYLFSIMRKLVWIAWIRECLSTTSYSVLVNGIPSTTFHPSRGLRQGDPLSPLLFALCTEGLISLFRDSITNNQLSGIRLNRHCPVLSHILFADDTFVFLQASNQECSSLLQLLGNYERSSGQRVNLSKSAIYFSSNTPQWLTSSISNQLQVPNLNICTRYLGLPTHISRSRAATFRYIEDRVSHVLQGWKSKNLSPAGMEVLIKSIASAIPCYAMSMFRFPKGLCTRLNKMIARFWWGASDSRRRIHWKSWKCLTKPKLLGGLNFRDFAYINQSLLAALCWRLLHSPNSLAFQVLKGRYFPSTDFLQATKGSAPSWCWSGILYGRELLLQGGRWLVGTGSQISTLTAPWLPLSTQSTPSLLPTTLPIPSTVNGLILEGQWNIALLNSIFQEHSVRSILSIPLSQTFVSDRFVWRFCRNGIYSASSGYRLSRTLASNKETQLSGVNLYDEQLWARIWSLQVQPKLRFFLWKVVHGILPTSDALQSRHLDIPSLCPVCHAANESISHLFVSCAVAKQLSLIIDATEFTSSPTNPIIMLRCFLQTNSSKAIQLTFFWWRLWKSRNTVVFEAFQYSIDTLRRQFHHQWTESYNSFQRLTPIDNQPQTGHPTVPSAPLHGQPMWTISVDAATRTSPQNLDYGATGFVVKNKDGLLQSATGQVFPYIHDPLVLELLAIRQALFVAEVRSPEPIHISSDSAESVRLLHNDVGDIRTGLLLQECRLLYRSLPSVTVFHISRLDNRAAHLVAREALNYPNTHHLLSLTYCLPPC
ncbi:LINE-1 retrotransposable element ORF2 protein [Linum grandiflorum]